MKIVILDAYTSSLDDLNWDAFKTLGELTVYDRTPKDKIIERAKDADAVLTNKVPMFKDQLDRLPNLKYLGILATGYNNVDLAACTRRGITVCNVPGYSTNAVAQHAFALLLCLCGNIDKYSASVANGDWKRSKSFSYMPWQTRELSGLTFGVYGYGNIGRRAAQIASAFGMNVIVCTRTPPADCPYELVTREEIFARSDVLSLHCPLTEQTKGLVNAHTLSLMKRSAILINTARGGLVDEAALAAALNSERIAGAGLDVLAEEPMAKGCPLFKARHTVITPHIAWIPKETRTRLVQAVANNLKCFIQGHPINVVNDK